MNKLLFSYNKNKYTLFIHNNDPSGLGCIREIVERDDYILSNFKNISNPIIDIGANCGVATIILAKQNPSSIIYAFEPHTPTYNLLLKNIEINNLNNVKIFNLAVSNITGETIRLYHSPLCSGGNTICTDKDKISDYFDKILPNASIEYSDVKTISLDDIISDNHILSVGLLKIDCEGAEFKILPDSNTLESGLIENMVGEFHDLCYNITSTDDSQKLLQHCKKYIDGIVKISFLKL